MIFVDAWIFYTSFRLEKNYLCLGVVMNEEKYDLNKFMIIINSMMYKIIYIAKSLKLVYSINFIDVVVVKKKEFFKKKVEN